MSEYKQYVKDRTEALDAQKAIIEEAMEAQHIEEIGALIEEIYNEDKEFIEDV